MGFGIRASNILLNGTPKVWWEMKNTLKKKKNVNDAAPYV